MSQIWAITLKELKAYFISPIAYIVTAMFLLVTGFFFFLILFHVKDAGMMRYVFGNTAVVLLLIGPLISMRLFAEEQKSKTMELLLTSPISDAGIVLGKYLASAVFLLAMLGITAYLPITLMVLGKPDLFPILTGYLGMFFMGSIFIALGMLTSTWTQNQIISAVSAFALSLIYWFLGAAEGTTTSTLGQLMSYLSLNTHYDTFTKGVLSTSDLLYFISVTAVLLFLTIRSLETYRWR